METGVTRKIDELGRIVIPKEIRKNLGIREGEDLEVVIDNDKIVLKKYSILSNYSSICDVLCKCVQDVYDVDIAISNRDMIIASSNEELIGKALSEEEIKLIDSRSSKVWDMKVLEPVVVQSDSLGCVIVYASDGVTNLTRLISQILVKLIEI